MTEVAIVISDYCPTCWKETEQQYEKEDERYEYYRCKSCNQLHKIAVR